jgi:chorismate mutase
VDVNEREAILAATRELLGLLVKRNSLRPEEVASAIFTTTVDVNAAFPAEAARQMGWSEVPLLCGHEIDVPGSLKGCIRILLHVNTDRSAQEMVHVYIKEAKTLRGTLPEGYGSPAEG